MNIWGLSSQISCSTDVYLVISVFPQHLMGATLQSSTLCAAVLLKSQCDLPVGQYEGCHTENIQECRHNYSQTMQYKISPLEPIKPHAFFIFSLIFIFLLAAPLIKSSSVDKQSTKYMSSQAWNIQNMTSLLSMCCVAILLSYFISHVSHIIQQHLTVFSPCLSHRVTKK